MKQYLYDILLLGLSHLFIIMILENLILIFYIEKEFSGGITYNLNKLFYKIADIPLEIPDSVSDFINKYKFIKDESRFETTLNNYENYKNKNNKQIRMIVIIVNLIVFIIVLGLIFYGKSKKNNLQIRWKYLIISNIVSFIIIGILDGIFITSWQGEMFNQPALTKQFINYIFY
jgi:membrane-associated HD superfamily phosphohydrolase